MVIRRERFDPPDLGTVDPRLEAADRDSIEALRHHLQRCAVEHLARVHGEPHWEVWPALPPEGDRKYAAWKVDEAADAGAVILARDPDGLRVEVDVTVTVGAQRTARRGVMPDDGWPELPTTRTPE